MSKLKIPDKLLEQAAQVPGLEHKLVRFIKLEVVQHEMRQARFRPETLALVSRARSMAEELRAVDVDLGAEKAALLHRLDQMTSSDASSGC